MNNYYFAVFCLEQEEELVPTVFITDQTEFITEHRASDRSLTSELKHILTEIRCDYFELTLCEEEEGVFTSRKDNVSCRELREILGTFPQMCESDTFYEFIHDTVINSKQEE